MSTETFPIFFYGPKDQIVEMGTITYRREGEGWRALTWGPQVIKGPCDITYMRFEGPLGCRWQPLNLRLHKHDTFTWKLAPGGHEWSDCPISTTEERQEEQPQRSWVRSLLGIGAGR